MKSICILGSGMGGSVLALSLVKKSNIKVTIIDCDSLNNSFRSDTCLEKKIEEQFQTVGYGFGGTSNLWHGVLSKLDSEDFMYSDNVKSELDLQTTKISQFFGDISHLDCKKNQFKSHQLGKCINLNKLTSKPYIVQPLPTRFRKKIKEANKIKTNLHIIENSVVVKLNTLTSDEVKSVEYIQDGVIKHFSADIFVVSLGALETPRLLFQSFKGTNLFNKNIS